MRSRNEAAELVGISRGKTQGNLKCIAGGRAKQLRAANSGKKDTKGVEFACRHSAANAQLFLLLLSEFASVTEKGETPTDVLPGATRSRERCNASWNLRRPKQENYVRRPYDTH